MRTHERKRLPEGQLFYCEYNRGAYRHGGYVEFEYVPERDNDIVRCNACMALYSGRQELQRRSVNKHRQSQNHVKALNVWNAGRLTNSRASDTIENPIPVTRNPIPLDSTQFSLPERFEDVYEHDLEDRMDVDSPDHPVFNLVVEDGELCTPDGANVVFSAGTSSQPESSTLRDMLKRIAVLDVYPNSRLAEDPTESGAQYEERYLAEDDAGVPDIINSIRAMCTSSSFKLHVRG